MAEDETQFDKFWEASNLDKFNVEQFSKQLNAYDSDSKELLLEFPETSKPLRLTKTKLNKIAKRRKSERKFSGKQLSLNELSRLLSSFYAWNGLEHRGFPSAGATYVTEVFGVAFSVKDLTGKVFYYDPENHGTVVISENAPTWEEASGTLNMNLEGIPSLLIAFVVFQDRATAKYGERGGRFALLEVGAAMQQLSLQIAESSKLRGVAAGGVLDEYWKSVLLLTNTNAKIALAYLVGK